MPINSKIQLYNYETKKEITNNTDEAYKVKRLNVELLIVLLFLFLSRNYKVVWDL